MNWPFSSKKRKELEKTKEINRRTLMQVLKLSDVERLAYWDTFAIRQSDPSRRFPFVSFPTMSSLTTGPSASYQCYTCNRSEVEMALYDDVKQFIYLRFIAPGTVGTASTIPGYGDGGGPAGYEDVAYALANAHRNPIVCMAISWIVDQASPTPMVLKHRIAEDEVEVLTQHPLLTLLRKPNEWLSGKESLAFGIWWLILKGQTFWRIERNRSAAPTALTPLQARFVEVEGNSSELVTGYRYTPEGQTAPINYQPDQIIQVRIEPDPFDPKNGLSPLVCVASDLLVDSATSKYHSDFLNEIGTAGGFLMPPPEYGVLSEEVAKATQDRVTKEFRGSKRGTIGVLRTAMEYIRTALDPSSVGTSAIRDDVVERILGALGIHPVVLGLAVASAQSRVGAATQIFEAAAWSNRIIPIQDTIGEQLGRQLLPFFVPEDEVEDWSIDWDRSQVKVLQPDMLRESQRWTMNYREGVATRYEAKVGQNLEADDTDKYYRVPVGATFIPQGEPPPPPPAPSAPTVEGDSEDDQGDADGQERAGGPVRF